jgi:TonB family protein
MTRQPNPRTFGSRRSYTCWTERHTALCDAVRGFRRAIARRAPTRAARLLLATSIAASCTQPRGHVGGDDRNQSELRQDGGIEPLARLPGPNDRGTGGVNPDSVYFDFQVEKQAVLRSGNVRPRYPVVHFLGMHGSVVVEFVVDTNGHVPPASIRVTSTGDAWLNQPVIDAVRTMRFKPAELHSRRVRERVQMLFTFPPPPEPTLVPDWRRIPAVLSGAAPPVAELKPDRASTIAHHAAGETRTPAGVPAADPPRRCRAVCGEQAIVGRTSTGAIAHRTSSALIAEPPTPGREVIQRRSRTKYSPHCAFQCWRSHRG